MTYEELLEFVEGISINCPVYTTSERDAIFDNLTELNVTTSYLSIIRWEPLTTKYLRMALRDLKDRLRSEAMVHGKTVISASLKHYENCPTGNEHVVMILYTNAE